MVKCFACKKIIWGDALTPLGGKFCFHSNCVRVTELNAPSRRNKRRVKLGVSFFVNGSEYVGMAELAGPSQRLEAIKQALSSACKKTVADKCRTPKGGNNGKWSRRAARPAH